MTLPFMHRFRSTQARIARLSRWLIPPLMAREEPRSHLAWLAVLRWLVVLAQLSCILIAAQLEFIPKPLLPGLLGLIAVLAGANLLAVGSLRQAGQRWGSETALLGWLLFDWCQFVILLSLNGGINNPFYPLIFVHAVLGASMLPTGLGWLHLLMLGAGIYLLNPVVYVFNAQQTFVRLSALVGWLIQFGVLGAAWAIAGSLSRRLATFRLQATALLEQQQRLKRVHLLGALGAGVAHEFATPLNTLRLRLERLHRRQSEDADLEIALRALSQCEMRLRQMAALPTRAHLSQLEPLLLPHLFQEFSRSWEQAWPGIELDYRCDLAEDFTSPLPELALKQALQNLLDNAAQAMQGHGRIELRIAQLQNQLQLSICDEGPGWPVQLLQHLGEPFVTSREAGTGLGLYTVHMLSEALGGKLELLAHVPAGACARLWLPLRPA